ncbi:hypothetical protein GUJ93_ZPchr0273g29057 [Zizania palustris]|uniref:DUF7597 domain-containing protein n=1 Tax=Zizania palustris TaxID=103762 RepID=A0A8J5QUK5_ZIZPA|nr:hypothetical protein GUJ93_ZPchr0273g29057 [Zizania palustris]
MANFLAKPYPSLFALSSEIILRHENFAIVEHEGLLSPEERMNLLIVIRHHIGFHLHMQVERYRGVDIYKLGNSLNQLRPSLHP